MKTLYNYIVKCWNELCNWFLIGHRAFDVPLCAGILFWFYVWCFHMEPHPVTLCISLLSCKIS